MTELEYWKLAVKLRDQGLVFAHFSREDQSFSFWGSCNDLFMYACSDADLLENINLVEVQRLLEQFGHDAVNIGGFADWCGCGGEVQRHA